MTKKAFFTSLLFHGVFILLIIYLPVRSHEIKEATIWLDMGTVPEPVKIDHPPESENIIPELPIIEETETPKPDKARKNAFIRKILRKDVSAFHDESILPEPLQVKKGHIQNIASENSDMSKKLFSQEIINESNTLNASERLGNSIRTKSFLPSRESASTKSLAFEQDTSAQGSPRSSTSNSSFDVINPVIDPDYRIILKKTYAKLYYPEAAQRAHKEGTATLVFKLNASGLVEEIELAKCTGYNDLDEIVLNAGRSVKGEKFSSTGKRVHLRLSVEFALRKKRCNSV